MSVHKSFVLVFVTLLLYFGTETAVGQVSEPIVLTAEQDQYPLGLNMDILADPEGTLTIEDVTTPDIASQFIPSQDLLPRIGFTDSAYWIRFQVDNKAETIEWLLLYDWDAFFVDYYFPIETEQGYDVIQTGTALPFDSRALPTSRFAFPLPVAPEETATFYMRVEANGSLALPLTVLAAQSFMQMQLRQQTFNSFLYGIFVILVLYHFIFYFKVRDASYVYYALFFGLMLLGMMALDDFGDQYLWPEQGTFNAVASRLLLVLSFTFATLFADTFLQTKSFAPRLHAIMIGLVVANLVVLGLQVVWFLPTALLNAFLTLASSLTIILAGFVAWRRHYSPAKYYLFGWGLFFVGLTLFVLTLVGWIPLTLAAYDVLRLGLLVLAVVLSFGLADRINVLQQEMEAAQAEVADQRRRIAQDLHDSVTQTLFSVSVIAETTPQVMRRNPDDGWRNLDKLRQMTKGALAEMRTLLLELRPDAIMQMPLDQLLATLADSTLGRSRIPATLIVDGDCQPPDDVKIVYYRVAQEAINNVIKHADATEIQMMLDGDPGRIELCIWDNGSGYVPDQVEPGHFGLEIMAERVAAIDGTLNIESAINAGTAITVTWQDNGSETRD